MCTGGMPRMPGMHMHVRVAHVRRHGAGSTVGRCHMDAMHDMHPHMWMHPEGHRLHLWEGLGF